MENCPFTLSPYAASLSPEELRKVLTTPKSNPDRSGSPTKEELDALPDDPKCQPLIRINFADLFKVEGNATKEKNSPK